MWYMYSNRRLPPCRHLSRQVLIFAENKGDVDDIHEYLLLKGVEAVSIHGGKSMSCTCTCRPAHGLPVHRILPLGTRVIK